MRDMVPSQILHFHTPLALSRALERMVDDGLGARGLLFLALDSQGHIHLAIAERHADVNRLKVGAKLALPWPFIGRFYYVDAVHPLGGEIAVVNGDRRIGSVANLVDVASIVSGFVRLAGERSVFFGCTPHQPGSWWVNDEEITPLHDRGFVEIVPIAGQGLLARRTMDDTLYFMATYRGQGVANRQWDRVFSSPLGNILMLERRLIGYRLVLSCQHGLIEIDLSELPKVREAGRIHLDSGYGVVGRVTDGAFAVAHGIPHDWGFEALGPATLVGSESCSFAELGQLLIRGTGEQVPIS